MPRENSFEDEGRSLTPDLEDEMAAVPPLASPTRSNGGARTRLATARTGASARTHMPVMSPGDRFRSTVRKVMQMRHASAVMNQRGAGAEPGIDPRRQSAYLQYGHIRQNSVIQIVDYSSVRSSVSRMTNAEFVNLMHDTNASLRESWVKVRWINIGGVSWDVISALAIRHDLHPLSIEDVLHQPRGGLLSKVDYYRRHLFMRVLCHSLANDEDHQHDTLLFGNPLTNHSYTDLNTGQANVTGLPRSSSPELMEDSSEDGLPAYGLKRVSFFSSARRTKSRMSKQTGVEDADDSSLDPEKQPTYPPSRKAKSYASRSSADGAYYSAAAENRTRNAYAIEELKRGERVNVKIQPMCIFLLRDGTVISVHPTPNLDFTAPITQRLRHPDTGLRSSADPSLLVHALLDLIVDRSMEVVDEYQAKILELEKRVLLHPKLKVVRDLHTISGDLILHRRTLEPVKTVVYGLRRYDVDRTAAMMNEDGDSKVPVKGYMSHRSKIYLADVVDHMNYIITSVDMFSGIAENLISYNFNMASNQMGEVMRRLTLATIILLPLTFLTGYFGMNFNWQWSVKYHSDLFFWEIAIPLLAVLVPLFLLQDIKRMIHYVHKRMAVERATPFPYKSSRRHA